MLSSTPNTLLSHYISTAVQNISDDDPAIGAGESCQMNQTVNYMHVLTGYMVPILFGLIVLIGFLGNLLVIVVIIANIQMRNTTNILIISLALADLAFIIFCVPFTAVVYKLGGWPLGDIFCRIYQYSIYITAYCSVYTLVLMSLDRYLAVVHPIESMTIRTERNTILAVIIMWIVFLCLNLPLLFGSSVVQTRPPCTVKYCIYVKLVDINATTGYVVDNNRQFGRQYFGLFFLFGYLLPLAVICVLYGLMIERLLFGRTAKLAQSSEAMRSKRRVTRMVVIVIVVFALCWLPIQVVFILQYFGPDPNGEAFRTIHVISNCLAYANSSVNPIFYAFLSENFRRAFLKFLCIKQRRNEPIDFERTNCTNMRPLLSVRASEKHQSGSSRHRTGAAAEDNPEQRTNNGELVADSPPHNGGMKTGTHQAMLSIPDAQFPPPPSAGEPRVLLETHFDD